MGAEFPLPKGLKHRWIVASILAVVPILIGLITFLFMLRVI